MHSVGIHGWARPTLLSPYHLPPQLFGLGRFAGDLDVFSFSGGGNTAESLSDSIQSSRLHSIG